ncbi:hypothetical protein GCM10014713_52040 [Streptomyces purpureus]|uniref:Uncharacterized protein n=1 Tax=Streptomyces purpureus TaxID=1951 RepID=A0A918HD15_9ACTN|nr:hypothetical protein GCM10014713_52040 [Streptomyces purpureus]
MVTTAVGSAEAAAVLSETVDAVDAAEAAEVAEMTSGSARAAASHRDMRLVRNPGMAVLLRECMGACGGWGTASGAGGMAESDTCRLVTAR